jgi:hypothetical protein
MAPRSTWPLGRIIHRRIQAIAAIIVVVGICLTVFACAAFNDVDRCLDHGGSFDYARRMCDLQASHPYQPAWFDGVWLALAGIAVTLVGLVVGFPRKTKNVTAP